MIRHGSDFYFETKCPEAGVFKGILVVPREQRYNIGVM